MCHEVRYTSRLRLATLSAGFTTVVFSGLRHRSRLSGILTTALPFANGRSYEFKRTAREHRRDGHSKRLTNSRVSENSLHLRKQYSIGDVRALVSSPERAPEGLGESVNTRVPPPLFCCCRFIACCCCRCLAFCSSLCFSCSLVRTSFRAPCHPCVLLTCTSHEQDDNTTRRHHQNMGDAIS